MTARIGEQLKIVVPNKLGMLAEISKSIASLGINIDALCAYTMGKKAVFLILTSNNALAIKVLKTKKFNVVSEKVVLIKLENRVGAAEEMGNKLRDAKIDLHYIYGTTLICGGPNLLVFKSNNNNKAVKLLTE